MKHYAHFSDFPMDQWRWPDFSPAEIACRGTGQLGIDERSMDMLQALRTHLGRPLIVNSGYRSPEHNRAVGGAKGSYHMKAMAFDVRMENHDPAEYIAAAETLGFMGIGTYPDQGFVHIDTRATPATWGKSFPARATRFSPEPKPRPVRETAGKAAPPLVVIEAARQTVQQAAPLVPEAWVNIGATACALAVVAVLVWPHLRTILRPKPRDEV